MKEKYRPIDELSLIFRGMNGDKEAQKLVTLGDTEAYIQADTFERFLEINHLPVFEQVLSTHKPSELSWQNLSDKAGISDRSLCWKILNKPGDYHILKILQVTRALGLDDDYVKNIWYRIKKKKLTEKLEKELNKEK